MGNGASNGEGGRKKGSSSKPSGKVYYLGTTGLGLIGQTPKEEKEGKTYSNVLRGGNHLSQNPGQLRNQNMVEGRSATAEKGGERRSMLIIFLRKGNKEKKRESA